MTKVDWSSSNIDSVTNIRTDTGLVRCEFDKWGSLMRQVRIVQAPTTDTMYTENLETGEMTMVTETGIADEANGYFKEYFKGRKYHRREGVVEMGRPIGIWRYFDNDGRLYSTVSIGRFGWPEGAYTEYHPSGAVRWNGAYGIRTFSEFPCPSCPAGYPRQEKRHERWTTVPIGEWKQYDDAGKLIQVVTYSWVGD